MRLEAVKEREVRVEMKSRAAITINEIERILSLLAGGSLLTLSNIIINITHCYKYKMIANISYH